MDLGEEVKNDNLEQVTYDFDLENVLGTVETGGIDANQLSTEELKRKALVKMANNVDDLITSSPIMDIFGGIMNHEIKITKKKGTSLTQEPFFILSLNINQDEDIESSLYDFFNPTTLHDYKDSTGTAVNAK